jgi:hypothetical protein
MSGSPTRGLLNGNERDQIILLTEQTTKLAEVVGKLEARVESIKDVQIVGLMTDNGITKNRLDRIEKLFYGMVAAVLAQAAMSIAELMK